MSICICTRTHTHTYIYMHKHAHTHKFINICIYMYICKETRWKSMSDLESYPPFKLLSTQYILKLNFKIFYFYVQLIFFSGNKISKYRQTVMLYMYSFQQYFSWINALYIVLSFNGVYSYIDKMDSSFPWLFLTNNKQRDNYKLILISSSNNTG